MNKWVEILVWAIAALIVAVSFLNPGGFIVALIIALALVAAFYLIPWVGDLVRDRQRGASAAKARKRIRGGSK